MIQLPVLNTKLDFKDLYQFDDLFADILVHSYTMII